MSGAHMSGHSKWHSIKHAKGAADAARGKVFARLARQIEVAARDGGGDIEANPTLRTMVQKARDASMPKDNIERAIKRGTGELEGVTYESITYEGYAHERRRGVRRGAHRQPQPHRVEVKNVFTRNGGSLAEPGAVAWQFERKGVIVLDKAAASEDDLMLAALDAGAEDIEDQGDTWQVTTPPTDLHAVRDALEAAGIAVTSADTHDGRRPPRWRSRRRRAPRTVLRVIDALEEHDDVQNVYANFDIPDDVLEPGERHRRHRNRAMAPTGCLDGGALPSSRNDPRSGSRRGRSRDDRRRPSRARSVTQRDAECCSSGPGGCVEVRRRPRMHGALRTSKSRLRASSRCMRSGGPSERRTSRRTKVIGQVVAVGVH